MLKDVVVKKEKIEAPGTEFEVKGLTIEDIVAVSKGNEVLIGRLFNGEVSFDEVITTAPALVAVIIAHAAGERNAVEQAASLPVGIQAQALQEIWNLTVPDETALKNLVARLERIGLQALANQQASQESGGKSLRPGSTGKSKSLRR